MKLNTKPHTAEWLAVIAAQNAQYPRCKHGTPTAFIIHGQPVCYQCIEEDPALRLWLKSTSLVSGGMK